MRTLIRTAVVALAIALAAPAAASAAGKVDTSVGGDVTYEGDAAPNVVSVTSTPYVLNTVRLVFSEPGITEGTDGANICTPTANTVTCTFSNTQRVLTLNGGAAADELTLDGTVGATINGGPGADRLVGGAGPDVLRGGADADTLDGRGGADTVDGEAGADVVRGGEGEDISFSDEDEGDQIDLGPGRDFFIAGNNDGTGDALRGGDGSDTLAFATFGVGQQQPFSTVDLSRGVYSWGAFGGYPPGNDSLDSVENAGEYFGSSRDDILIGDAKSNLLAGGSGNDTITGGRGTDTLLGDKSISGVDQLHTFATGTDTIDGADGFEDQLDCGGAADSVVADQFDQSSLSDCEMVDLRQTDPFGIPPAPAPEPGPGDPGGGPGSGSGSGGTPRGQQPEAADNRPPRCSQSKLAGRKRAAFVRRGFTVRLACDEPARVEATASVGGKVRRKGAALVPGDVVLGQKTLGYSAGRRTLAFRVPRAVRRSLGRRFTVRLRIDVIDRTGNATTRFTGFKVR
jgi:Ca2+-binding RTX toxin-like protein